MGYFNEFPHTRGYDGDLGWLIKIYKELFSNYLKLIKIYENILENIKEATDEQLQEWLEDGTLENIINQSLFNELNEQINKINSILPEKTNITEYNQKVLEVNGRTYGIREKGTLLSAINNVDTYPQITNIFPASKTSANYPRRDSVGLYTYVFNGLPIIEETSCTYTSNTVMCPDLDDSVTPSLLTKTIAEMDFSNTIADIYVNGTHTYYGYIANYDSASKTFTLVENTGFYKLGDSNPVQTYVPPIGSTLKIGAVTASYGANIIVDDNANNPEGNFISGIEVDLIKNKESSTARGLHIVSNEQSHPIEYAVLAEGGQGFDVGSFFQAVNQRGYVSRFSGNGNVLDYHPFSNQLQDGTENWYVRGDGVINNFKILYQGNPPDGVVNPYTYCILQPSTETTYDTSKVQTDSQVMFFANFGSANAIITNYLGGGNKTIAPNYVLGVIFVGTAWYPIFYSAMP